MIPSSRQQTFRRFGYYLIGVALGCVLLGIYFQGRRAYVARRAEAERAAEVERAAAERGGQRAATEAAQPPAPTDPSGTPKTPEPGVK